MVDEANHGHGAMVDEARRAGVHRVAIGGRAGPDGDGGLRGFFFSSRRRHTRFDCDWSSDVCSSDLDAFSLQRICSLGDALAEACKSVEVKTHRGGTYLCMEGPAFSTVAESNVYRSWGMDIIGMTNLQEAKLAREAEICYATLALVTEYDCWHPAHVAV